MIHPSRTSGAKAVVSAKLPRVSPAGMSRGAGAGAAWFRLFRRDAPGYGFVNEETPELSISVVPSRRPPM